MTILKNFILILALGISFSGYSQLFVKPSGPAGSEVPSYVFVNDTFIYVEQDVELEINELNNSLAESSIILRNEAQLLQGNGADQDNKGTGDLSIFQEGTVNRWDYNFWGSPVGLAFNGSGGAAADGNSVFSMRPIGGGFTDTNQVIFNPENIIGSNPALLAGGFDGSVGDSDPLRIATHWLWTFRSGVNYAEWFHLDNVNTLEAGYGFTMKGVNGSDDTDIYGDGVVNNDNNLTNGTGQRMDFRGRPNNGTIPVEVGGNDALTLVGNPYPSALDLDYFLLQNSGSGTFSATDINENTITVNRDNITTGVALFWDSNPNVMSHFLEDYQGGYGMYSPMMTLGDGVYVNATYFMYDDTGALIPGSDGSTPQTAISYNRRFAPVGQGFMIQGDAGGDALFTNNQRMFVKEGNNSDFRNNEGPTEAIGVTSYYPDVNNMINDFTTIKIGVGINDTYSRELGIGLHKHATTGYDIAGDARIGGLPTDVSFNIEDGKGYVINAAPQIEHQLLPITLDAEIPSEFRFIAHYTENFDYDGVYLFDKQTETYHDILNESVLIQLEAGEHGDRFAITFVRETETSNDDDDTLSVDDVVLETGILESFAVYQNNPNGQLEIHNPLGVSLDTMSLFDMAGKLVISENELGIQSIYSFPTTNLSAGIYIAQFVTSEGLTKARKISVTN